MPGYRAPASRSSRSRSAPSNCFGEPGADDHHEPHAGPGRRSSTTWTTRDAFTTTSATSTGAGTAPNVRVAAQVTDPLVPGVHRGTPRRCSRAGASTTCGMPLITWSFVGRTDDRDGGRPQQRGRDPSSRHRRGGAGGVVGHEVLPSAAATEQLPGDQEPVDLARPLDPRGPPAGRGTSAPAADPWSCPCRRGSASSRRRPRTRPTVA